MRLCLLAFCLGLALPARFTTVSVADLRWALAAVVVLGCVAVLGWAAALGCVTALGDVAATRCGAKRFPVAVRLVRSLRLVRLVRLVRLLRFVRFVRPGGRSWNVLMRAALGLLLGLVWALWLALRQQAVPFPVELEGVDFWVEGVVTGLVQTQERSQRFEFQIDHNCFRLLPEQCLKQPPLLVGQRIVLNDYSGLGITTGDRWRLRVRLTRAYGVSNPGGRDSQARLRQQGVIATGYVRETSFNANQGSAPGWRPLVAVQRWRSHIAAALDDVGGLSQAGVIKALVIGDYGGLSSAHWEVFNTTGTSHLMVISGMHIGFVALLVYGLVNVLCRLSVRLLNVVAAQQVACVAALLAGLSYSLLAGFSLPAQRALIMLTVLMAGRLFGRRLRPSYSLLLAAALVLMRDPLAVTQAGFWLSFMAVASLLLGFVGYLPVRERDAPAALTLWQRGWRRWVVPQWVVSCGLLLPLLVWTGQVSLVSPLTNVLAIPLVSLAIVPAALLGTLLLTMLPCGPWPPGNWLLTIADMLLQWLIPALSWLATTGQSEPGSIAWPVVWQPAPPDLWSGLLLALASVILLLPRGLIARWYALLLLLPVVSPQSPQRPAPGELWVHFLDVGQGLAVVLQTHRHTMLFDTGPGLGPGRDTGDTVIVPFLRHQRIDALHMVIVSHWHEDHSGGLQSVLQQLPVSALVAGRQPDRELDLTSLAGASAALDLPPVGPGLCRAGWSWEWDDVSFSILHPDGARYAQENDYSCVLKVEAGGQSLLLTGDIEARVERLLVAGHGAGLRAQVLQAAHHGSATSSTALFLDSVQPELVVIPAAYHNRFSHPAADVQARLAERDIRVLQTGRSGAITLRLGASVAHDDGAIVATAREHRRQSLRHWQHLPP